MTTSRRWLTNENREAYLPITVEHLDSLRIVDDLKERMLGHQAVHCLNARPSGKRVYLVIREGTCRFPVQTAMTFYVEPGGDPDTELDEFLINWAMRLRIATRSDPSILNWKREEIRDTATPNFQFLRYAGVPKDLIFENLFRISFRQATVPEHGAVEVMQPGGRTPSERFDCNPEERDEAIADYLWSLCLAHLVSDRFAEAKRQDNVIMAAGKVLTDMQTTGQSRTRATLRPDVVEAAIAITPSPPESSSFRRVRRTANGISISFDEDFIEETAERITEQLRALPDVEVSTDPGGLERFSVKMTEERLANLYRRIS